MSADKKVPYRAAGYNDLTPYLSLSDCLSAIDFYKRALHAKELVLMKADMGGGEKVVHAELQIGDSKIMLSEDFGAAADSASASASPSTSGVGEKEKTDNRSAEQTASKEGEKSGDDDENGPNPHVRNPLSSRTTSTTFVVYVQNVDEAFEHALKEGATAIRKPKDQFYGDRSCAIRDPFGHVWNLQTHVEDVTPEDMKKRMAAMSGCGEGPAEKKQKIEKKATEEEK